MHKLILINGMQQSKNKSSDASKEKVKQEEPNSAIEKSIGGDKDVHGCLIGAGQSWSELKKNCIQVFNEGQRLNPVEIKEGEAIISAFAVFNGDSSKVELFLPNVESSIILDKTEGGIYYNDTYKLDPKQSTLYIRGEKKYVAEK